VNFSSRGAAAPPALDTTDDENAAWNELDVEQALKQNFRCSFLVMLLEMTMLFAFFRAGVVYYGR